MREDAVDEGVRTLRDAAGPTVATASDFDDGAAERETLAEAIAFENLAVALGTRRRVATFSRANRLS